ncbi:MAG: phosphatase [bacterium]
MKIAVIDMGTNTCNFIIAERDEKKGFHVSCNKKYPVKLGEGGINSGIITGEAYRRGLDAISNCMKEIASHNVEKVHVYATSAVRSARNGEDFVRHVKQVFNIDMQVIPGEREADLIYKGIRQSVKLAQEKVLILDIGGGSNELIIADYNQVYWKESIDIGMARVLEYFQPSDPITHEEISRMEAYFEQNLSNLKYRVMVYKPMMLIGASGSFETFSSLLMAKEPGLKASNKSKSLQISIDDFLKLHSGLLFTTLEERKKMKGMEMMRVEMIVLASIFVNCVLKITGIKNIIQTDYSLKEGVVVDLLSLQ